MTREVTTEWKKSRLLKKPLTFSYRLPRDGLFFSVLKCCMMRWSLLPTAMCNSFLYSYTNVIAAFGGLGVACWPLVPTFAGWNPTEAVGFLRAKKILSMPSFGGEVKPSVPCRRFAACKRSLNVAWKSSFRLNCRTTFSPTVPTSAAGISRVVADVEAPGGEKWEHLKSGGKQWQTTPKNFPRMQRTRAIPVAWLSSGLCPDRPKGWIPIIIQTWWKFLWRHIPRHHCSRVAQNYISAARFKHRRLYKIYNTWNEKR